MQPLLDPSRLKPPTMLSQETRNSQLNLSIGLQHQQQQQLEDENEILSISQIHESCPKVEML